MSSIRLSGTSSGYYDLTVPAVAGTNSIDLSNLVVGNTAASLTGPLTVSGSQSQAGLKLNSGDNNTASGGASQIDFGFNGSASYRHNITTRHDSAQIRNNRIDMFVWQNSQNAADNGNRHVASFDGAGVTLPNQPGWHGTHQDNYASTYSAGIVHNMIAGTVNSYNIGNHFDYSTDRFTVPVTGYYLMYGWDVRRSDVITAGCGIGAWKNGTGGSNRIVSSYHEAERGYAFTTVAYLAVNDWVSFGCTEGGTVAAFYGSSDYSGYGIRLIS